MRKLTALYFFVLLTATAAGQGRNSIWFFGKGLGLDFNSTPPKALTGSGISPFEGSASICDKGGKLLFYSDGNRVLDRTGATMPNGVGLLGDLSSTNNCVIVPSPTNADLYYLFTTGGALQEDQSFAYNIIDMTKNGGMGDVVTKNVILENDVFEKIAAVSQCDSRNTWIIVRKWNTDEYHAYMLSPAGLTGPVISHTGLVISGFQNNMIGTLKTTTDGAKLVAVHSFDNDLVELMDFNKSTGVITNPVIFSANTTPHAPTFIGAYGAEFSPNNKYLYISANNSGAEPAVLYQFDISVNTVAAITASRQVIAKPATYYGGALQLGPDGKIYMAAWKANALSVIDNPNGAGAACNFLPDKIKFPYPPESEVVQFGLPTFIQSSLDVNYAPHSFSRTESDCTDPDVQFHISRNDGLDSVRWNFGDLLESTQLSPLHHYAAPGHYDVRLIVFKKDCAGNNANDTIRKKVWIAANSKLLRGDTSTCDNISLRVGISPMTGATYLWSDGTTDDSITVSAIGKYWIKLSYEGCSVSDTFKVLEKPRPVVNLGPDTSICLGKVVVLDAGVPGGPSIQYLWNTGATSRYIPVGTAGEYKVTVTDGGCAGKDSVAVIWGDCELFLPSAFTPNNDGLNDKFGVASGLSVRSFSFRIFNKWGQAVFETANVSDKWDGTYKGKAVPNGAYIYMLSYTSLRGRKDFLQGTVMLLR